jgi:lipoprotein-anchoring transpeptidase ErfK/SrfK
MFSGWAVSPWGIRKVDLLFDNGQVRVPTKRIEDPGVTKALPWYPATPRPRFIARFDRRPWYIRPDTDVQVEITDGNGNKTVWDGRPINWIR